MKTKTFKFVLNIIILTATMLLMDPRSFYGLTFHEIAGLIICLFYILHIIVNWIWVKGVTVRFFKNATWKARFNYTIDWLMLIGMFLVILSGLPIAKIIDFSWMGFDRQNMMFWRLMHTSISMLVIVITGIHLALHWDWITNYFRKSRSPKTVLNTAAYTLLVILITAGAAYAYDRVNFQQKTSGFFQHIMSEGEDNRGSRGGSRGRGGMRGRGMMDDRNRGSRPEENVNREEFRRGGRGNIDHGRGGRQRNEGHGRRGRHGGTISLTNVMYYSLIMVFCTVFTRGGDTYLRRRKRAASPVNTD